MNDLLALATAVLRHLRTMSEPPTDLEVSELCRLTGRLEYHSARLFAHCRPAP